MKKSLKLTLLGFSFAFMFLLVSAAKVDAGCTVKKMDIVKNKCKKSGSACVKAKGSDCPYDEIFN